jgi:inhibitor of cysteine peptidase
MDRSAMGLLLLLVASSLVFTGVAGMSLFGPQTFGAGDNGKSVTVNNGETFWIQLPENPTTGYAWDLKLSDGLTKLSDKYEPADRSGMKVGVGGTHSYEIKAMKNGSQIVTGSYRQTGNESSEGLQTYTLNVNVTEGGPLSGHDGPQDFLYIVMPSPRVFVNYVFGNVRKRSVPYIVQKSSSFYFVFPVLFNRVETPG